MTTSAKTAPRYFVAIGERALWVATMPLGTVDLAFAQAVARSIPGSQIVSA